MASREDVTSHGAVGDGVTDDKAAIAAAATAAGADGVVYFPPGTYRLSSTYGGGLAGQRFVGEGATLMLPSGATTGGAVLRFSNADMLAAGLKFAPENTSGRGIQLSGATRARVERCAFSGSGVYLTGTVTDAYVEGVFRGGMGVETAPDSITSDVEVVGRFFDGDVAVQINAPSGSAAGWRITRPTIRRFTTTGGGNLGYGITVANATGVLIDGMDVEDIRMEAVHVEDDSSGVQVRGGRAVDCGRAAVSVQPANGSPSDVLVADLHALRCATASFGADARGVVEASGDTGTVVGVDVVRLRAEDCGRADEPTDVVLFAAVSSHCSADEIVSDGTLGSPLPRGIRDLGSNNRAGRLTFR